MVTEFEDLGCSSDSLRWAHCYSKPLPVSPVKHTPRIATSTRKPQHKKLEIRFTALFIEFNSTCGFRVLFRA